MAGRSDPADPWKGYSTGFAISTYLLAALLFWGGVGYLIDHLASTGRVFTAVGMVVGAAAGTYLIYLRFGRGDDSDKR
jgi:F0F1-type ATP synthase assembly protein I